MRALLRLLWLVMALALLPACDGPPLPRLPALDEDAVILAFGDSLTFGTGAGDPAQSYPAVLADLSGRQVINAGEPGEISAEGLTRLEAYLDEWRPDLVILCHGGNDLLRRLDAAQLESNLVAMIETTRDRGTEVVLLAVPDPGVWMSPAPVYQRIAREHSLVFDNDLIANVESDARLKSDPVHPNANGYRRIAEGVLQLLQRHGAL